MAATAIARPPLALAGPARSALALLRPGQPLPSLCPTAVFPQQASAFSTTRALHKRRRYKTRDRSKLRGVSTIRRTGPREFLSVSDDPLPVPRRELPPIEVDADHGLWDFFYKKQLLQTPVEDADHGRAWMAEELRHKSWDDLHKLWWVCVKERNRIATATHARKTQKIGFGDHEADERDGEIKRTMQRIKHILTERQYVWEDAVELARTDPEIDLSGEGAAFTPTEYLEAEEAMEEAEALPETDDADKLAGEQSHSTTGEAQLPLEAPATTPGHDSPRV